MSNREMTVIRVEGEETLARIVVGFLESNGIEVKISEDDAGDQIPAMELTRGVKIFVPVDQADEAKRLLEEREAMAGTEQRPEADLDEGSSPD